MFHDSLPSPITGTTPDIGTVTTIGVPKTEQIRAAFRAYPETPRLLDPGMGVAVAQRTVFRPSDEACFGKVADRVAAGNMSLLGRSLTGAEQQEQMQLRNAIATGALLTSGRHLQHGDATQIDRPIEVYTNCSTAIATFSKFYLLLNGSGVGRSYDDALIATDWQQAPTLLLYLSPLHPDYPHSEAAQCHLGVELGVLPRGTTTDPAGLMHDFITTNLVSDMNAVPADAIVHRVADSREGWAKAVEILEAMTFHGDSHKTLLLDFSDVRRAGAPIGGMQNRPASGPISLMRAFINSRNHVLKSSLAIDWWEQALRIDHYFSVEVQVGGARRSARMATKSWRDPGVLRFIRIKSEGGLWTANHSIMVDAEFWQLVNTHSETELGHWAQQVFDEATRCAWINGEPGFINGDALEDHRTSTAWDKPIFDDGRDFHSSRYHADEASGLLAEMARRAASSRFPVTTNPCGEITLHVTGGYCVHGSTRILHRNGYDRIIDLVGRSVEVFNGKTWSTVTPFQTGTGRRLLRVTLSDGSYLDCTPEHRFSVRRTRQGDEWKIVSARNLYSGSILPTFRVPGDITGTTEPEAYTYGAFLGDGGIEVRSDTGRNRYTISLYEGKHHLPVTGTRGTQKVNAGVDVTVSHLDHERLISLKDTVLPDWVFGLDRESTRQFILGWLDTDGCYHKGAGGVSISTGYEEKARGLQLLLRRLGFSYVSVQKVADVGDLTNFGPRVLPSWKVYVPSVEAGLLTGHRVKSPHAIDLDFVTHQPRVVSVTEIEGEYNTYCFTEPSRGMGVFGNMLTHQCVLADYAPLLACPVDFKTITPGQIPPNVAKQWDARVEASVRLAARFLVRANTMDALYGEEVSRTNRMGIGPTGLHEWAWMRYGLDFNDLLDETVSAEFWQMLSHLSAAAKQEGCDYSDQLGRNHPTTVTTIKPAGCASLETAVRTTDGSLTMRDLFARHGIDEATLLAAEDGTWFEPTTQTTVFDEANVKRDVTKLYKNGIKPVYAIEFEDGTVVKLTGNHQLKTQDGMKRVDALTEADEILQFDIEALSKIESTLQ